jgi:elongation factor 1 alpha-like protein
LPTIAKPAAKQNNPAKTKVDLSIGLKSLSVEEPVKIRSKNLNVLAEYKKVKRKSAANFVVIGTSVLPSM